MKTHAPLFLLVLSVAGCDKLKAVAGGSAEGGVVAPPSIVGELFAPDFQGEVTMKMTSATKPGAGPSNMVVGIKKPKYRIDMTTPQSASAGSLILDLPTKKGWVLMHQPKMAMELDLDKAKSMKGLPGMPKTVSPAPSSPPKVEKTGRKETIAGYSCEVWNVTSDGKRSELCMAEGLSWIDMSDVGMAGPEVAFTAVASEANRFPLRVIAFDAKGAEEMRMEAQKIEKKPLPDTSFVPPADYTRVAMGGLPAIPGLPTALPTAVPPRPR
ncbi:MAG: DUF4412 domain-containing protein [Labilithrix sp.]|nr:DUF4412 domain-containing protein [Labilithrix sp.]MCW5810215.1 DUF4412 domain-containing protein [Labilithrix sp.]